MPGQRRLLSVVVIVVSRRSILTTPPLTCCSSSSRNSRACDARPSFDLSLVLLMTCASRHSASLCRKKGQGRTSQKHEGYVLLQKWASRRHSVVRVRKRLARGFPLPHAHSCHSPVLSKARRPSTWRRYCSNTFATTVNRFTTRTPIRHFVMAITQSPSMLAKSSCCAPSNWFRLGRRGQRPIGVCPCGVGRDHAVRIPTKSSGHFQSCRRPSSNWSSICKRRNSWVSKCHPRCSPVPTR
jgi:hypothetical protein